MGGVTTNFFRPNVTYKRWPKKTSSEKTNKLNGESEINFLNLLKFYYHLSANLLSFIK